MSKPNHAGVIVRQGGNHAGVRFLRGFYSYRIANLFFERRRNVGNIRAGPGGSPVGSGVKPRAEQSEGF
jgi:hypothetical protein